MKNTRRLKRMARAKKHKSDLNLTSLVSYFGDRTYLVPPVAAAFGLLWLTPLRQIGRAHV